MVVIVSIYVTMKMLIIFTTHQILTTTRMLIVLKDTISMRISSQVQQNMNWIYVNRFVSLQVSLSGMFHKPQFIICICFVMLGVKLITSLSMLLTPLSGQPTTDLKFHTALTQPLPTTTVFSQLTKTNLWRSSHTPMSLTTEKTKGTMAHGTMLRMVLTQTLST